ncbi:hypothetical protein SHI21_12660 [Bacteriovorax sp. PP10]|uniref:Uncharacterized protein n=1 Tax=Bacteriovorax antarcticus TaxID=3088717 RepID=A0ABU5VXJ4_9BACT|nr:hypothetical protein [Bacteriovorax sp. PP10]MEA9357068.1 hypothetical protein [Bacteriovorax sp. PP10]
MKKMILAFIALMTIMTSAFAATATDFANTKWVGKDDETKDTLTITIAKDLSWKAVKKEATETKTFSGKTIKVGPIFGGEASAENPVAIVFLVEAGSPKLIIPPFAIVDAETLSFDTFTLHKK